MTESMRVLRMKAVTDKIGVARSTIYDWMDERSKRYDASFPKPVRLGGNSIGWIESDLNQWLESKLH